MTYVRAEARTLQEMFCAGLEARYPFGKKRTPGPKGLISPTFYGPTKVVP